MDCDGDGRREPCVTWPAWLVNCVGRKPNSHFREKAVQTPQTLSGSVIKPAFQYGGFKALLIQNEGGG